MELAARRPRVLTWAFDVGVAVATAAFALAVTHGVAHRGPGQRGLDVLADGMIVAASLLLVARRRWPLAVVAGIVALDVVYVARDYPGGPGPCAAGLIALATLAARRPTRVALLAGGGALLASLAAALLVAGAPLLGHQTLIPFVWVTVGVLAGMTVRSQHAAVEASEARAREAERTRAEEARRQMGEERLRIARELHDVLAHSLATIHVQASTGAHVVARRPEQAEQVLTAIKQTSQEALADLRTTVSVLRTGAGGDGRGVPADGEGDGDGGPRRPQPSLARVEELLDGARRTGARVTIDVSGQARRLPAPVDVAGYRIVQEALTNVVRHAGATAVRVAVAYEPDGVALTIDDDGCGGPAADGAHGNGHGSGHGLAGMRERAALLGGSVDAGPRPGGGYRVHARLPVVAG